MRTIIFSLLFLVGFSVVVQAQEEPVRSIVNVTGDLYRFQNNNHYGVFLVTSEGIILADPINADTATWLKGELDERFGVPVKYVIYSHDHADHTSGGEVFADTAEFIAHENAALKIADSGHTPVPDITFESYMEIKLGNREVILDFPGPSHSDNLIAILFEDEKTLFLVDVVAVKRLPYRNLPDYDLRGAINFLQYIENLEYDILIPGHGPIGDKDDLKDHQVYLANLYNNVLYALLEGKTLEETKASVTMEDYQEWSQYDAWLTLNIEGAYRIISEKISEETTPIPTQYKHPSLPRGMLGRGICGYIILSYDIGENGKPKNIEIVESIPKRYFDQQSKGALRKWRFTPGKSFQELNQKFIFKVRDDCKVGLADP